MKCAFFHDHRFFIQDDKVYSSGSFPDSVWDTYLSLFDKVVVFGRKTNNKDGVLSEKKNISFQLFPEEGYFSSVLFGSKNLHETVNNILHSVDCVIIRLPSLIGYFVIKSCRILKIPYAVEVVGCQWDSYRHHSSFIAKLLAPILYFKMKNGVKNATHVIYVTKYFLQKRYPSHGDIGDASDVILHDLSDTILEKRLQKISNRNQNLIVGLLAHYNVKYKGFDVLIKALSILKSKGIIVTIRFAGGGTKQDIMKLARKYKVENQVECIGLMKNYEVMDFLDNIDVYVHPSRIEGLPRAIIEAFSRACPVLASSAGGIPELLDDKYLHHPGDYKTLASHLTKVIDGSYDLVNMAKQNFNTAQEYLQEILNDKKNLFWKTFYEYVKSKLIKK